MPVTPVRPAFIFGGPVLKDRTQQPRSPPARSHASHCSATCSAAVPSSSLQGVRWTVPNGDGSVHRRMSGTMINKQVMRDGRYGGGMRGSLFDNAEVASPPGAFARQNDRMLKVDLVGTDGHF